MRVFLYTLAGLPLLVADGILLYTLPAQAGTMVSPREGWILLGGGTVYLLFHFLLHRPERIYLWGHEFAHLIVAKIFFRRIHQFQISSRSGGKVVMDRTNVMIDLAPYTLPLYCIAAGAFAQIFRYSSSWVPLVYLALVSFLFTMHLVFSAEGFVAAQPDLTRSGRIFSAGVILLFLLLWIPCLLGPGASKGWTGTAEAYRGWKVSGEAVLRSLVAYLRALFP